MEHLMRPLAYVLVFGTVIAVLSLRGWLDMRRQWGRPVTWRDYRRFRKAVIERDHATIRKIAIKYGAIGL